jgi:hypothetical protein
VPKSVAFPELGCLAPLSHGCPPAFCSIQGRWLLMPVERGARWPVGGRGWSLTQEGLCVDMPEWAIPRLNLALLAVSYLSRRRSRMRATALQIQPLGGLWDWVQTLEDKAGLRRGLPHRGNPYIPRADRVKEGGKGWEKQCANGGGEVARADEVLNAVPRYLASACSQGRPDIRIPMGLQGRAQSKGSTQVWPP